MAERRPRPQVMRLSEAAAARIRDLVHDEAGEPKVQAQQLPDRPFVLDDKRAAT